MIHADIGLVLVVIIRHIRREVIHRAWKVRLRIRGLPDAGPPYLSAVGYGVIGKRLTPSGNHIQRIE